MRSSERARLALLLTVALIAGTSCTREMAYEPRYSGALAQVADSVFASRPIMICRKGSGDECWTRIGDTTAFFYATPDRLITAVGRELRFAKGELAPAFNELYTALVREQGPGETCAHGTGMYQTHDHRWRRDGHHVLLLATTPGDNGASPTLLLAHILGPPNCDERPLVPLVM